MIVPGAAEGKGIVRLLEGVTLKKSRVRQGPSFSSPIADVLDTGTSVSVRDMEGDWFNVATDSLGSGWIHKSLLRHPDRLARRLGQGGADPGGRPAGQDLVSLSFRDTDIRDAFSSLAMEFKTNIVLSADVKGSITLHIFQTPLEDAIRAVAAAGGYTAEKKQGTIHIARKKVVPPPRATGPERQMKSFRLNFVEMDQVKEVLNALPGMAPIQVHENTKTVFVEDTPENIRKVDQVIAFLDSVPKQVFIEAKILEVILNDEMEFGVDWQVIWRDVNLGTGGFSNAILPTQSGVSAIPGTGSGGFGNLFAATGDHSSIAVAIDALKEKTSVRTVSTPKIIAVNGRPARVQVGGQQGYRITTTNLGVVTETIEFIDTGVILKITPYIDKDNNILLNVQPSINTAKIEEGIPVVNSTTVSTWLIAQSGETVFIGGLIEDSESKSRDYVPVLGDIPVVGHLFGRTSNAKVKTETVVMITPKILDPGAPVNPLPPLYKPLKRPEKVPVTETAPPPRPVSER